MLDIAVLGHNQNSPLIRTSDAKIIEGGLLPEKGGLPLVPSHFLSDCLVSGCCCSGESSSRLGKD